MPFMPPTHLNTVTSRLRDSCQFGPMCVLQSLVTPRGRGPSRTAERSCLIGPVSLNMFVITEYNIDPATRVN